MSQAQDLARSIRRAAHDVADRKQQTQVAIIRRLDPLTAELTESGLILDEEDLTLGQSVRRYDADKGLKRADSLLVVPLKSGQWVAHEVLSDEEPPRNVDASESPPKVTGSWEGNAALKSLLKRLDELGIVIDETT